MAETTNEVVAVDSINDGDEGPRLSFAARIGSFILDCSNETDGPALYKRLFDAIHSDSRVVEAEMFPSLPPMGPNVWPSMILYMPPRGGGLGTPFISMHLIPMFLKVDVPLKNQRRIREADPPSEVYYAAWDGITLVVSWPRQFGDHVKNPSGGHIVGDIIRDAAKRCNLNVVVQACVPLCEYEFNHTTLLVDVVSGTEYPVEFRSLCSDDNLHVNVNAFKHGGDTIEQHTKALLGDLRDCYRSFAIMKNLAVQAYAMSVLAAATAGEVAHIQSERAHADVGQLRARLKKRLAIRGWRRKSRAIIADAWLQLGELENLRRSWHQAKDAFEAEVESINGDALFKRDYRAEASDLERLNVELIQAQVQHAAERLDNRDVVVATVAGALAGAFAGGAASFIA